MAEKDFDDIGVLQDVIPPNPIDRLAPSNQPTFSTKNIQTSRRRKSKQSRKNEDLDDESLLKPRRNKEKKNDGDALETLAPLVMVGNPSASMNVSAGDPSTNVSVAADNPSTSTNVLVMAATPSASVLPPAFITWLEFGNQEVAKLQVSQKLRLLDYPMIRATFFACCLSCPSNLLRRKITHFREAGVIGTSMVPYVNFLKKLFEEVPFMDLSEPSRLSSSSASSAEAPGISSSSSSSLSSSSSSSSASSPTSSQLFKSSSKLSASKSASAQPSKLSPQLSQSSSRSSKSSSQTSKSSSSVSQPSESSQPSPQPSKSSSRSSKSSLSQPSPQPSPQSSSQPSPQSSSQPSPQSSSQPSKSSSSQPSAQPSTCFSSSSSSSEPFASLDASLVSEEQQNDDASSKKRSGIPAASTREVRQRTQPAPVQAAADSSIPSGELVEQDMATSLQAFTIAMGKWFLDKRADSVSVKTLMALPIPGMTISSAQRMAFLQILDDENRIMQDGDTVHVV